MSTSLAIPTDADFMSLSQYFSDGFNVGEWQLSTENEFGPLFSECFDREPPLLATDSCNHATTSALTAMGPQPNLSTNICFPGAGGVTAPTYFTSEDAYPTGYFPSSDFTFHVAQPAYPSSHYYPEHPSTSSSNSPTYNGPNTSMEYEFGLMQAATYGSFPSSSSHCSDPASTQSSLYDRVALEAAQPTASGSNPHSALEQAHQRTEDDNATEVPQQPPKKRRRVRSTSTPSASASSFPSSSPSGSSSSVPISSHHSSASTSPGPSAQPSANYVRLPDGRYRCRICTGKAAFADTEKDIVRHLETAKAHNHERILCKDTVYRCPCRSPRFLGKRKDSHKRHVRTYIVAERREAIEAQDQERLSKVDAYEARLKSEKLL